MGTRGPCVRIKFIYFPTIISPLVHPKSKTPFHTMNPKRLSLRSKYTTFKSRFTKGFLQALQRINRQRSISSSINIPSPMEMCRRYLSVKNAADAAMASAVGTRRAWSSTLLTKINRSHKGSQIYNCSARRTDNSKKRMKMKKYDDEEEIGTICEADELRKFVPGGDAMDICSLLDEAAHYIKCLKTQVKVMERIADICSAV